MKLVTVATHPSGYFSVFMQSCKRFGIQPIVLGYGQKWQGFTWRWKLLEKYLETLPDNELVTFTDAYDVIIMKPLTELEKRYNAICPKHDKIVMSTEPLKTNDSMLLNKMAITFFGLCQGKRINAGTYVGPKRLIIQMIKSICNDHKCETRHTDDQKVMTSFCDKRPDLFLLDTLRCIFYVCTETDTNSCDLYKNYDPCILHAPGNTTIDQVAKSLGYDLSNVKTRQLYDITLGIHIVRNYINTTVIIIAFVLAMFMGIKYYTK